MKPIEPGCLALFAYGGKSAVVTVLGLKTERILMGGTCAGCGADAIGHFWFCSNLPPHKTSAGECALTRIDGFEETEEIEEEAVA